MVPVKAWLTGVPAALLLWLVLALILLWLVACGAQLPNEMMLPTARAALANPSCVSRCYVSVTSTDDNKTGQGTFAPAGTRSGTITETTTETK